MDTAVAFFVVLGILILVVALLARVSGPQVVRFVLRARLKDLQEKAKEQEERIAELEGGLEYAVPVFYGQAAITAKLEELRDGAGEIRAIWSGEYGFQEVDAYFEREADHLARNPHLRITRLVSENAVPPPQVQKFKEFVDQHRQQLQVERTDVREFEHFIVHYPGRDHPVAMLIINKPVEQTPTVGFLLDPNANDQLALAVEAVSRWFDSLAQDAVRKKKEALEKGRERASEVEPSLARPTESVGRVWLEREKAEIYDDVVTANKHKIAFLDEFLTQEQAALEAKLKFWADLAWEQNRKITIVEVGCGTGRSLLRIAGMGHLDGKVEYVIGFDYSPEMLKVARRTWRTLANSPALRAPAWDMLQRFRFYELDALRMNDFFLDGRLRSGSELDQRQYVEDLKLTQLDDTAFNASNKVFICLLNTIGVILDDEREEALRSMMMALGKGDHLILSVFDAEIFSEKAQSLYPNITELTGKFDPESSYDHNEAIFRAEGSGYFSRWFHRTRLEQELKSIAQNAGIHVRLSPDAGGRLKAGGHFLVLTRER
jgi:SAM-dependent methyltransferase